MKGPILIQGAMDVETDWLVSRLEAREETVTGGFRFWRGRCGALDLVVSRTEIGTIRCAAATALGVTAFRPRAVINQGVAGSHREDLHVGDLVVGRSCIHIHDLKTQMRNRGRARRPSTGNFTSTTTGSGYSRCMKRTRLGRRCLKSPWQGTRVSGRLGSGDVFNREIDRILWLRQRAGSAVRIWRARRPMRCAPASACPA